MQHEAFDVYRFDNVAVYSKYTKRLLKGQRRKKRRAYNEIIVVLVCYV